mgnify:CR=1 FL=1
MLSYIAYPNEKKNGNNNFHFEIHKIKFFSWEPTKQSLAKKIEEIKTPGELKLKITIGKKLIPVAAEKTPVPWMWILFSRNENQKNFSFFC